ncbi:hypothetical protein EV06_0844 [Prochlorococcus sp. MIT 0602]|nr:hypothetical protein EV06_0844 [Prochlorococcus sp. MIT 0602]
MRKNEVNLCLRSYDRRYAHIYNALFALLGDVKRMKRLLVMT